MTMEEKIDIENFIKLQLEEWPLASENYEAINNCRQKEIPVGGINFIIQYNPGRIKSTGVDLKKIIKQQSSDCFLCKANRPGEQKGIFLGNDLELLVNPYPIFNPHYTIASTIHIPQSKINQDIISVAERLPGMAVFFNGAKAGASMPGHFHYQAVAADRLPLLKYSEETLKENAPGLYTSHSLSPEAPFLFYSGLVNLQTNEGKEELIQVINNGNFNDIPVIPDFESVNWYVWKDKTGFLRYVIIPRKAHRPKCYGSEDEGFMISPGCIDMAGVIITPREKDFERINEIIFREILNDVSF